MMNLAHGTMGAGVAVLTVNLGGPLWLGLGLAFLSHFALDAIPHWDPVFPWPLTWKRLWPTLVDFLTLGMVLFWFWGWKWMLMPEVIFGAGLGILPDFMLGASTVFQHKTWVEKFHEQIQKWQKPKFWRGFGVQILVVLIWFVILGEMELI